MYDGSISGLWILLYWSIYLFLPCDHTVLIIQLYKCWNQVVPIGWSFSFAPLFQSSLATLELLHFHMKVKSVNFFKRGLVSKIYKECVPRLYKELSKLMNKKTNNRVKKLTQGSIRLVSWVKLLSRVRLFTTPWTVAYWAPLSMGFSRQGYPLSKIHRWWMSTWEDAQSHWSFGLCFKTIRRYCYTLVRTAKIKKVEHAEYGWGCGTTVTLCTANGNVEGEKSLWKTI